MLSIDVCRSFQMPEPVRREVLDLCAAAFGQPFDILFSLLPPDGLHVMGRVDGRLVAHLVVSDRSLRAGGGAWLRTAYIDAVATHPDFVRRGFASEILSRAIRLCEGRYDLVALATNVPELYAKMGFVRWQGRQLIEREDGAGEVESEEQGNLMVLPAKGAVLDVSLPMTANWRPGGGY